MIKKSQLKYYEILILLIFCFKIFFISQLLAAERKQEHLEIKANFSVKKIAKDFKFPIKVSNKNILFGEKLYQDEVKPIACSKCHGKNGNGFGIMAWALNPLPRNFTQKKYMKKISNLQMFDAIKNGSGGTACLPNKGLKPREIWQIIMYIRTLGSK